MARRSSTRTQLLLLAGAAIGIAIAATGLVSAPTREGDLPADAVARVNGSLIRREDYDRLLDATAQDRREPLDAGMRHLVLDRLIEEELLVQRGLELGLAEQDRKIRSDLTSSVIASVTEEYGEIQPTDKELEKFYRDNLEFFSGPGRIRLRQVFVATPAGTNADAALQRAQQASSRLRAGEDFATVRNALGDMEIAPVPDSLLPPAKLRDYIGPTATQTAAGLTPGEVSDPVRSSMGYHVLQMLERQADPAPPFAEVRTQVAEEYRRRAGEQALRRYLEELRRRATVVVAKEPS